MLCATGTISNAFACQSCSQAQGSRVKGLKSGALYGAMELLVSAVVPYSSSATGSAPSCAEVLLPPPGLLSLSTQNTCVVGRAKYSSPSKVRRDAARVVEKIVTYF